MYGDQTSTGPGMGREYWPGMDVYDVNGEKVGTVSEHGVQDNSLVVHHGLLRQDVYIPLAAIQRSDADGLYLNITKDEALNASQGQMQSTTYTDQAQTAGSTMATTNTAGAAPMNATTTQGEDVRIPLRQEELVAGKRQDEIGQVHLHKDVVEEQQTVNVPLQREEVTVERVPVSGTVDAADTQDAFQERDIDVPVRGEEAVLGKQATVKEEVRLHKQPVTEQEQVSGTVRKERVTAEGADQALGADDQTNTRR